MTLNFAELTQKMRAGERASQQDLLDMITAGPGATFALVEFAAEFRRTYFRNAIELPGLIDESGKLPEPRLTGSAEITLGQGESAEQLAEAIYRLAQDDATPRVVVHFAVPEPGEESAADALTPMHCLRALAAVRLAAPAKSLRVGTGRREHLRTLQSLALHVIDSMYPARPNAEEPQLIFEDLKLIRGASLSMIGAEHRDIAGDYVVYLESLGVADAQGYADAILTEEEPVAGGCGGNCSCGSGGCSN